MVACIPAFNEERTIAKVVLGAQKHVNEVVVCDDGSSDMTAEIAEKLGAKVIRHPRNMGKGEALRSLFLASRELDADVMVTLDGDAQHDPDDIVKLVEVIKNGTAEVVIGARFTDDKNVVPAHRRFGNKLLNFVTPSDVTDTQSGFRAYGKRAIMSILPAEMGMGVDSEILMEVAREGLTVAEIAVSVKYGIGKTSTHNPVYHILDVIFSVVKIVSVRHPMLFYGIPGLVLISAGIYFALQALIRFTQEQVISNNTMTYELIGFALTVFGLLTFFTGIILFTVSTVVRKREQE